MLNKWKSVSKDFIYNIVASFVLTGTLQAVVYPFLAYFFDVQEYGLLLTVMGIVNMVSVVLGNTLNNVRLLVNNEYDEKNRQGDFNIILIAVMVLGSAVIMIISKFLFQQNGLNVVVLGLCVVLAIFKQYHCVQFRIILNFKKVLLMNIVSALGCIIGIAFTYILGVWSLSFFCGEICCVIYLLFSTNLYREKYQITELFSSTTGKYIALILAGLAGNLVAYLDRLIIYPILGGEAVSTYTVAAVFGKSLGIVMTPIGGVLLGYYTQKNFKLNKRIFWKINITTLLISVFFVVVSVLIAPVVLRVLYPGVYEAAKPYLLLANLATTLAVTCALTQPAVLKGAPTWLQVLKEAIYAVVYVGVGMILLGSYGLMGFCIAALTANMVKLLTLYILGNIYIK